ncbi:MAG TPA: hypothetical protein VK174_00095 [Chitinophagales bacterium]|nr:hypothetical protein [Chitinophagales bacterium]
MRTYVLIATLAGLLFASGCRREVIDCEANRWGILRLSNTSSQDVRVYIDDVLFADLPVYSEVEYNHIASGYHHIYAQQVNSQLTWESYVTVLDCERLNVAFTP